MKVAMRILLGTALAVMTGWTTGWTEEIQPDELSSIPVDLRPDQTVRLALSAASTNSRAEGCGVSVKFLNSDRKTIRAFEADLVPGRALVFDLSSEEFQSPGEATTIQAIVDFPPDPCHVTVTPALEVIDTDTGETIFTLDQSYFVSFRWAETCDIPLEGSSEVTISERLGQ